MPIPMSQVFAVQVRTFELVPRDSFVWVDAPDELAAYLGASRAASGKFPEHLLRQVVAATPMGDSAPPNLVDVVVDRFGDEYEVEVL